MSKPDKYESKAIIELRRKANFKFNNGRLAMLCPFCSKVLKEGKDFTEIERKASIGEATIRLHLCDECKQREIDNFKYPEPVDENNI